VSAKKSILVAKDTRRNRRKYAGIYHYLRQSDEQHLRTFLTGKMTDHKIVGTFVDDAGTRGEWTAVPYKSQ
jgi:hypothetical protein